MQKDKYFYLTNIHHQIKFVSDSESHLSVDDINFTQVQLSCEHFSYVNDNT